MKYSWAAAAAAAVMSSDMRAWTTFWPSDEITNIWEWLVWDQDSNIIAAYRWKRSFLESDTLWCPWFLALTSFFHIWTDGVYYIGNSCLVWRGCWASNVSQDLFLINERNLYRWDQIFQDQRPAKKGLKRWWVLVCFFPLKRVNKITSKHWKEDSCCVNRGIDPASITYWGEIKPPTLPRSVAPACVNLYSEVKATAQLRCPFKHKHRENSL